MTKEETNAHNVANLNTYMDERGIPEGERDELPFGEDNPPTPGFYVATVGVNICFSMFLYWDGNNWLNAKGWKARDVTGWEPFEK